MGINQNLKLVKILSAGGIIYGSKNKSGRNNSGKIVRRHRGGGSKKKIRIIDYYRSLWNIPGIIVKLEYNPKKRAIIALVSYFVGILAFINSMTGFKVGYLIKSSKLINNKIGNCTFLKFLSKKFKLSLLELVPNGGASLFRSPGSWGKLININKFKATIRLRSGSTKMVSSLCTAVIGINHILKYRLPFHKRAGINRLRGIRPSVRGVAMNPVDHPHGGGEGKKSQKSTKMSIWGKLTKKKK